LSSSIPNRRCGEFSIYPRSAAKNGSLRQSILAWPAAAGDFIASGQEQRIGSLYGKK